MEPYYYKDKIVQSKLKTWLRDHRILYVDTYIHHSGGNGPSFFVDSPDSWEKLVIHVNKDAEQHTGRWTITVFKKAFSLRGRLDDALLTVAKSQYGESSDVAIINPLIFPDEFDWVASGDTWQQVLDEIEEYRNETRQIDPWVCIGIEPDFGHNWLKNIDPDRMVINNTKKSEPSS